MLTVKIMKGKCRFASFPEVPVWGMVLAAWPQEYSGVTWTKEVQHVAFQGVKESAAHCLSNGKTAVKVKKLHHSLGTLYFMLEAAISASWVSGCWTSIAANQISYPMWECILYQKKTSSLQSLLTSSYKKIKMHFHTYIYLSKMEYTYPPYLSAIAHSTGLFAAPHLAGRELFSLPHYLFHRTYTKLNGELHSHENSKMSSPTTTWDYVIGTTPDTETPKRCTELLLNSSCSVPLQSTWCFLHTLKERGDKSSDTWMQQVSGWSAYTPQNLCCMCSEFWH